MATWDQIYHVLFQALGDQGYRPVAPAALPDPTIQAFPATGDSDIDSALVGATAVPNWGEIARQLRQFSLGRGFAGLAVRRDKHDLEVVVTRAYGSLLTEETADTDFEHTWTIAKRLSGLLDQFHLSDEAKQEAAAAFEKYKEIHTPPKTDGEGSAEPVKPAETGWDISQADVEQIRQSGGGAQPAAGNANAQKQLELLLKVSLSVLHFIWDVANTSSATTVDLFIGAQGLAPELVSRLESLPAAGISGMFKTQPTLHLVSPTLSGVGIDCPSVEVHGHATRGSLDLGQFGNSIRWYLQNGVDAA